jgi:hypothetical protein
MSSARRPRLAFLSLVIVGVAAIPVASVADPAPPKGPVHLHLAGSESVKVRIFQSPVGSCEERESAKEYEGVVQPGTTIVAAAGCCLCVQQTYAPLINVGWSIGKIACRYPTGGRWRRACIPSDSAKRLDFDLKSRE